MRVFIYSRQIEISQIISDHLSAIGNRCFVFLSQHEISEEIQNQKKFPDLIILDYTLFNHDIFNLYSYLEEMDMKMPIIFYNDPCLICTTRAAHWEKILDITLTKHIPKDYSHYRPLFTALEELIESKEFKPYISLLQPAEAIPLSFVKDSYTLQYLQENKDDCIYQFKERSKLPNNLFYLLQLLQKNKETELSFEDLIDLYAKDGKTITEESLRVLMSKLKRQIRNDKECTFLIYRDKDRYRFIRYKV